MSIQLLSDEDLLGGAKATPSSAPGAAKKAGPALLSDEELLGGPLEAVQPTPSGGRNYDNVMQDAASVWSRGSTAAAEGIVGAADLANELSPVVWLKRAITGKRDDSLGKMLDDSGYGFKEAKKFWDDATPRSDVQLAADKKVADAQGVIGTAKAAIQNPSTIVTAVGEAGPSIAAGGAVGRGFAALVPRLAKLAGYVGEGVTSAGSTAEQVRQDSKTGNLTAGQAAIAGGSGLLVGLLGALGGKVGKYLGIDDIDQAAAGVGKKQIAEVIAEHAATAPAAVKRGIMSRTLLGAMNEGLVEEVPQSFVEQLSQNYAEDKPLMDGMDKQLVMGGLAGGVMGGGHNLLHGGSHAEAPPAVMPAQQQGPTKAQDHAATVYADIAGDPVKLEAQRQDRSRIALVLSGLSDDERTRAIDHLAGGNADLKAKIIADVANPDVVQSGRQTFDDVVAEAGHHASLADRILTDSGLRAPAGDDAAQNGVQAPTAQTVAEAVQSGLDEHLQGMAQQKAADQAQGLNSAGFVEEHLNDLQAQIDAVKSGRIKAAVVSLESLPHLDVNGLAHPPFIATGPDGKRAAVITNDPQLGGQAVTRAADVGLRQAMGEAKGYADPTLTDHPISGAVVVQQHDENGRVLHDELIHPDNLARMQRVPGTTISVKPVHQVRNERLANRDPNDPRFKREETSAIGDQLFGKESPVQAPKQLPKGVTVTANTRQLVASMNGQLAADDPNAVDVNSIGEVDVRGDHRISRLAKAMHQAFGIQLVVFDTRNGKGATERNNGEEFNTIHGVAMGNKLFMSVHAVSKGAALNTMGHEMAHVLQREFPEIYKKLEFVVFTRMRPEALAQLHTRIAIARAKEGVQHGTLEREVRDEAVAEAVGEMTQDQGFWKDLFGRIGDGAEAKSFYDKVVELLGKWAKAFTRSGFIEGTRDMQTVRKAITEAYLEWSRQHAGRTLAQQEEAKAQANVQAVVETPQETRVEEAPVEAKEATAAPEPEPVKADVATEEPKAPAAPEPKAAPEKPKPKKGEKYKRPAKPVEPTVVKEVETPEPEPVKAEITVASKKISNTEGFPVTKVTLSNGKTFELVKVSSAESMGLPGWHLHTDDGKEPDNLRSSYIADTKTAAIEEMVRRESGGKPTPHYSRSTDEHKMAIQREERATIKSVRLSDDQKSKVAESAAKLARETGGNEADITKQITATLTRHLAAHPVSKGWAPLEYLRSEVVKDDAGKPKIDEATSMPAVKNVYKSIAYAFHQDGSGKANPATEQVRVKALAGRLVRETLDAADRAAKGDETAKVILRQAGWYRNMRSRIRAEFGGFGDFFADLLGATSPNNPVRTNWDYAIEALRMASRGDYDHIMPAIGSWYDQYTTARDAADAYLMAQLAAGKTKVAVLGKKAKGGGWERKPDPVYQELAERAKELSTYKGALPARESGKKFGINTGGVVEVLGELWRAVEAGTAPKARNFSGNLIGFRKGATIDVWAARLLRRMAGMAVSKTAFPRIPPMAETGVGGLHLSQDEIGGEFGFGQKVFAEAAKKLRESGNPVFEGLGDDDLQAIVWFAEKELWTRKDWTSVGGEGGSFEQEADLSGSPEQGKIRELRQIINSSKSTPDMKVAAKEELGKLEGPLQRFTGGLSVQKSAENQGEDYVPTDPHMAEVRQRLEQASGDHVVAFRASPTLGRYGADERSFDIEGVTRNGHNLTGLHDEMREVAAEAKQDSFFTAKVVPDGVDYDPQLHRPGVEIYFREPVTLAAAEPMLAQLREKGVEYFTFITDGRRQTTVLAGKMGNVVGVRMLALPEFSARYGDEDAAKLKTASDAEIAKYMAQQVAQMHVAANEAAQVAGVSYAKVLNYEVNAEFREGYHEASRLSQERAGRGGRENWAGKPVREAVAAADRSAAVPEGGRPGGPAEGVRDDVRPAGPEVSYQRAGPVGSPAFKAWFGDSKVVNEDGSPKVMYHGTARDFTAFRPQQADAIFLTDNPKFAESFVSSSASHIAKNSFESLTDDQRIEGYKAAGQRIRREYLRDPQQQRRMLKDLAAWREAGDEPSGEVGDYFREATEQYTGSSPNIMPLYVAAKSPFDYGDPAQVKALVDKIFEQGKTFKQGDGQEALIDEDGKRTLYTKGVLGYGLGEGNWSDIEQSFVQEAMQALGHDGFYVEEGGEKNLAVFQSTQVKSVTGNRGTYDAKNADIRFRRLAETTAIKSKDGEPLRVFHGHAKGLTVNQLSLDHLGKTTGNPSAHLGLWFTSNPEEAARYGEAVSHTFLDIRKPKRIRIEDFPGFEEPAAAVRYRQQLQKQGFDGIAIDARHLGGAQNFVAFDNKQIVEFDELPSGAAAELSPEEAANMGFRFQRNATHLSTADEAEQFLRDGKLPYQLTDTIARGNVGEAIRLAKTPGQVKGAIRRFADTVIEHIADHLIPVVRWVEALPLSENHKQRLLGALRLSNGMRAQMEEEVQDKFADPLFKAIAKAARATSLTTDQIKKIAGYWMSATYAQKANSMLVAKDRAALADAQAGGNAAAIAQAQVNLANRLADVNRAATVTGPYKRGVAGGLSNAKAQSMVTLAEAKVDPAVLKDISQHVYAMMAWKKALDLKSGKVSQTMVNSWPNHPDYVPLTGDPRYNPDTDDVFSQGGNQLNQTADQAMNGRTDSVADDAIDAAFQASVKSVNFAAMQGFKAELNKTYMAAAAAGQDVGLHRAPVTGIVRNSDDVVIFRHVRRNAMGHEFVEAHAFSFADPHLMDALKKNTIENVARWAKWISVPTRWYARFVTQFMPLFAPVNFIRDTWERNEMMRTRALVDATGKKVNVSKAANASIGDSLNPAVWRAAILKATHSKTMTPERGELEQLIRLGGMSSHSTALARSASAIEAQARSAGSSVKKVFNGLHRIVEIYNMAFEMVPSLTAFRALKAQGMTAEDAAAAVLDMMDFSKKGASMANARALYTFAQPAATSGYNLARYLSTRTGQIRFAAQLVVATALYAMLKANWEDDDDKELGNKLDNLSNYTVERSIPVRIGGVLMKIPVGFGAPQLAWALGSILNRWQSGRYTAGTAAAESAKAWVKSVAPVQPSEIDLASHPVNWMLQSMSPMLLKPLVNIGLDSTAMGGQLTPSYKDPKKLLSEQAKRGTSPVYTEIAKELHDLTGVDMYPDHVKALVDGYVVGPAHMAVQAAIDNPAREARGEPGQLTGLSQLVDTINDRQILTSIYYRVRGNLETSYREYESAKTTHTLDQLPPEVVAQHRAFERFQTAEKALAPQRAQAYKRAPQDGGAAVRRIEERSDDAHRRVLQAYFTSQQRQ